MKLGICITALLFATAASAQSPAPSPAPAPERPSSGNLNLKLDDKARRNILVEPPAEKASGNTGAALPALGAGNPARSFDPPTGSRPKSTSGPFPKGVDAM